MPKIKWKRIFKIVCLALCALIAAGVPAVAAARNRAEADSDGELCVLSVWQIDSFEGGRGSRAAYLQKTADKFSKINDCYLTVTSLTADAARANLARGTAPDLISYGAGTYGLESYIRGKTPYRTWCHGGYCLLTLNENGDFSDANAENTVINSGTGNLVEVAAALEGLSGAAIESPTSAYVRLINNKYRYLLGTQRDIFRLKTRGVVFSVKPVESFNDLYQNISVTSDDTARAAYAEKFISYLIENADATALGLMSDGKKLYTDELSALEGVSYGCKLSSPVSKNMREEIESAAINCDENKLKTLLKSLK